MIPPNYTIFCSFISQTHTKMSYLSEILLTSFYSRLFLANLIENKNWFAKSNFGENALSRPLLLLPRETRTGPRRIHMLKFLISKKYYSIDILSLSLHAKLFSKVWRSLKKPKNFFLVM